MNEEKIYKIKRANSYSGDGLDQRYRDALNDSRFRELIKTNSLDCEYFVFLGNRDLLHISPERYITIDPTNVCATIVKLSNEYIEVKLKGPRSEELKEILENDEESIMAYCRILIDNKKRRGKPKIKIITFDIVCRRKFTFIGININKEEVNNE